MRKTIFSLFLLSSISLSAQIVSLSGPGTTDFFLSTSDDTVTSLSPLFAGVKVDGNDSAIVWLKAPTGVVDYEEGAILKPTELTSVILELSDSMFLDYTAASGPSFRPLINGGLHLGFSGEIFNNDSNFAVGFPDNEQYKYTEQFTNSRSYLISPSLKDLERSSFRLGDGTEADGSVNSGALFSLHFWDNKTESYVTGHIADPSSLPLLPPATNTGSVFSTGENDVTTYDPSTGVYTHHIYDESGGFIASSEEFGPQLSVPAKGYAVWYGDTLGTSYAPAMVSWDTLESFDGFYDGTIVFDMTNQHQNGFFKPWHLLGNPYRSPVSVSSLLEANNFAGVGDDELFKFYDERTLSLFVDVDPSTPSTFEGGFIAVNAAGIAVGLNDQVIGGGAVIGDPYITATDPMISGVSEIAPGQGFFLSHYGAVGDAASFTLKNSDRVSSRDVELLKTTEDGKMYVDYMMIFVDLIAEGYETIPTHEKRSQIAIALDDDLNPKTFNASLMKNDFRTQDSKDLRADAKVKLMAQASHDDLVGYKIMAASEDHVNKLIPLNVETLLGKTDYTFFLSKNINNPDYDVYVVDRALNIEACISKGEPYRMKAFSSAGQQNRFFLKFKLKEDDSVNPNDVTIISDGGTVFINAASMNTEISEVSLYDPMGRLLMNEAPSALYSYDFNVQHLPAGAYIVKVKLNNDTVVGDKILIQ